MIRAHFTSPCLYLAEKKIVDRLNIPSLHITGDVTLRIKCILLREYVENNFMEISDTAFQHTLVASQIVIGCSRLFTYFIFNMCEPPLFASRALLLTRPPLLWLPLILIFNTHTCTRLFWHLMLCAADFFE
jgi:hypothetical protein